MASTIVFEELAPPPALELSESGSIPLACYAYMAIPETGLFGYGELPLTFEAPGFALDPAVIVFAYGELPLTAGFSFVPKVVELEMEGSIPLFMLATTDLLLGRGSIPLSLSAMSIPGIPTDDSPVAEVDDWVVASDAVTYAETAVVTTKMAGSATALSSANRASSASESLTLRDQLRAVLEAVIVDEAAFEAAATGESLITVALVDTLRLLGAAESTVAAMAMLSDAMAVREAAVSVQDAEANDAAALTEAVDGLARALEVVVSTAVFSESVQALAVLTVLIPETVALDDTAEALAIFQAVIDERLELAVGFTLDGVPYVGIAINTANRAVTEYDNFNFNSLAWNGRHLYGAGPDGLYRLAGDTDAGAQIRAYLRTPMQRIAEGKAARVTDAYLGFRSNGTLQLKVIVNDNAGRKVGYVYDLVRAPVGAPQPGRFKVGRRLKSVYMAFELGNVAGDDFAIDVLEIRPLVCDRRLP